MKNLDQSTILKALEALDSLLSEPLTLVIGGGGALVMAYSFPLATEDVDAFSKERMLPAVDALIKKIGRDLKIAPDWLNPYYSMFTAVLEKGYSQRLREVFSGQRLKAFALGPEDLLLMKCFAARDKDIPHAKALLKVPKINLGIVEDRIEELIRKNHPGAVKARDFFDDITGDL